MNNQQVIEKVKQYLPKNWGFFKDDKDLFVSLQPMVGQDNFLDSFIADINNFIAIGKLSFMNTGSSRFGEVANLIPDNKSDTVGILFRDFFEEENE